MVAVGPLRRITRSVASRLRPRRWYAAHQRRRRRARNRTRPNRYHARSHDEAAAAIVTACRGWAASRPGPVAVVGRGSAFQAQVVAALGQAGLSLVEVPVDELEGAVDRLAGASSIALAVDDSHSQFAAARRLIALPDVSEVPLEYVALPRLENAPIREWDAYVAGDFVSPGLVRHGDALFAIYREALDRFRLKTDIRDYLDLCQLLESVEERGVVGNVAEFGSYHGHSGYLTSRVLEHLGSDKQLFLFDMFESFPQEPVGIDGFWSGTHAVDFEQVKARFHDRSNVEFVKGDFTKTLAVTDTGPLALAFVDCDSYRATRALLPELWENRVPVGGIVALEDYGHAALLGNRVAVHEFFDGRRDAFTSFSHFSGFFVAVKLRA